MCSSAKARCPGDTTASATVDINPPSNIVSGWRSKMYPEANLFLTCRKNVINPIPQEGFPPFLLRVKHRTLPADRAVNSHRHQGNHAIQPEPLRGLAPARRAFVCGRCVSERNNPARVVLIVLRTFNPWLPSLSAPTLPRCRAPLSRGAFFEGGSAAGSSGGETPSHLVRSFRRRPRRATAIYAKTI